MQPITNLSEGTGYAGAYPAHLLNLYFGTDEMGYRTTVACWRGVYSYHL